MPLSVLLAFALTGFAANSLLTRAALGSYLLDPVSFMLVRLASGAMALSLLTALRSAPRGGRGSWTMAVALAGYAVAFTFAYERIGAGAGALLLFAAVHLTMFGAGIARGERPSAASLGATAIAFSGLIVLTLPGLGAPDPIGAALMVVAGACWGVYSLIGRSSKDPLATTADNFVKATVLCLPALWLIFDTTLAPEGLQPPRSALAWSGVLLAVCSGAITSGLAYAAWYAVLPKLAAWRAALFQLTVPIIAATAAALLLDERMTPRLLVAIVLVVSGVFIANRSGRRPRG